ncbi:MAG: transaldolase, partial [candidate division Zixibacteria bacterium]|nr:transaldolase [candidate division Zixibacteria bacterium]
MTKMQQTNQTATDFWNDSCDLKELSDAVAQGAVGATSNPVIVSAVVKNSPEIWGKKLDQLIVDNPCDCEDDI